jgi:nucleotide sugar dehydrogenase
VSQTVAVVGLGKIGLPLAIQYARSGYHVVGCDINEEVVAAINTGVSHVHEEAGLEEMLVAVTREHALRATSDTSAGVSAADIVVVIVPVLVKGKGEIDYQALDSATRAVGAGLRADTLVIYETTLPVGTTAGRIRQGLEQASGLTAGVDFLLAYSPERVSSGTIFRDLKTYPKVVGGLTAKSVESADRFYRAALGAEVIRMNSCDDAEFVKLIETTYRDVNIALANEYAKFADALGLDLAAATTAANTQPYSHVHSAGLGVGGHCIPVYPYFLIQGARDGLELPRRARQINDEMADYAAQRLELELGDLRDTTILLLGVAYRADVRETAYTSARLVVDALRARGAIVVVDDPLYTAAELEAMGFTPFSERQREVVSAIVLQAAHSAYASMDVTQYPNCRAVLDGRRGLARATIEAHGVRYLYIGDGAHARRLG